MVMCNWFYSSPITYYPSFKKMKIICIGRNYADHISELNNEKTN